MHKVALSIKCLSELESSYTMRMIMIVSDLTLSKDMRAPTDLSRRRYNVLCS